MTSFRYDRLKLRKRTSEAQKSDANQPYVQQGQERNLKLDTKGFWSQEGGEGWPEYKDAIFQADAPVFDRLWEYVQRRLDATGTNYYDENQGMLEELRTMPFPEQGCKMAITLKNEENKIYDDVLR